MKINVSTHIFPTLGYALPTRNRTVKNNKKYNQQPTFILHTPGGTLINLTPVPKESTYLFRSPLIIGYSKNNSIHIPNNTKRLPVTSYFCLSHKIFRVGILCVVSVKNFSGWDI